MTEVFLRFIIKYNFSRFRRIVIETRRLYHKKYNIFKTLLLMFYFIIMSENNLYTQLKRSYQLFVHEIFLTNAVRILVPMIYFIRIQM